MSSLGSIELYIGPMFAGKTTAILERSSGFEQVYFLKPSIDNRYGEDFISTHNGQKVKAFNWSEELANEFPSNVKALVIDEIQFFGSGILGWLAEMKSRVELIIVSGLDKDFLGRPFEMTTRVQQIADKVVTLKAGCAKCGAEADFTHKKIKSESRIEVGASDIYEPRCGNCHPEIQVGTTTDDNSRDVEQMIVSKT